MLHGPHRLSVEDAEPRPLASGEVRVAVHAAGICGSDVHGYVGANARRAPGTVMGHEACGTVVERADGPAPEVGTPVAINPAVTCGVCRHCRTPGEDHLCEQRRLYGCVRELPGAFAEQVVVRAENVVPLEGPAPLEWGALVEPFAVGDHGVALAGRPVTQGLLVIGGGPIGLGAALAARRRGWRRVVLSEPLAHRRRVAQALGLEVVDPAAGGQPGIGPFGAAVECVAAPATLDAALSLVMPGGDVILVGMGEPEIPLPVMKVVFGERTVRGSFNYTREGFAEVAGAVMSGEVDLSPVIESRVDLEGVVTAFREYADRRRSDVKTIFRPVAA